MSNVKNGKCAGTGFYRDFNIFLHYGLGFISVSRLTQPVHQPMNGVSSGSSGRMGAPCTKADSWALCCMSLLPPPHPLVSLLIKAPKLTCGDMSDTRDRNTASFSHRCCPIWTANLLILILAQPPAFSFFFFFEQVPLLLFGEKVAEAVLNVNNKRESAESCRRCIALRSGWPAV